jgi:regulator of protease activity HflC (stomatin/prohibitin superfamily)
MEPMIPVLLGTLGALGGLVLISLRQINEWEVGLKFTLGKLSGRMEPGIHLIYPIVQRMTRIDKRIRNRDLPRQTVITRDNVTATVDAVVYFKVVDPQKAILNVENYENAVKDRAKVVLRDVIGEITLDELLSSREEVAAKVRAQVEQFDAQWGMHMELIALQDIQLPDTISDAIAKKAIAERDKQVVIIKSQADVESAKNFAEAARVLQSEPGALELRRFEALQGIAGTGNTKVIFDLARPARESDVRMAAAAVAAAVADTKPVADVRVETRSAEPAWAQDAEQAARRRQNEP